MAQSVDTNRLLDPRARERPFESTLHGTGAHRPRSHLHSVTHRFLLAELMAPLASAPAATKSGKQKLWVLMPLPPSAKALDHGRRNWNIAILTTLPLANVKSLGASIDVRDFDSKSLTEPKTA